MPAEKAIRTVVQVYFTAVLFLMYYFVSEAIFIGGIGITLRHVFALVVIFSAFLYFLIRPDVPRAAVSLKAALVFGMPLLVIVLSSMLVWVIDRSAVSTIMRGLSGCLVYTNILSCALTAGAVMYVFGEDGIWWNLAALLGANLLMIFSVMLSDGVGTFMREFVQLILSFAGNTGDTIIKAEIHELAFCLGAYLIYMLYKPRKKLWFWVMFALAVFCFLAAFKRIAILAMAAVAVLRILFFAVARLSDRAVCRAANAVMLLTCVLLVGYIWVIKLDVFSALEKLGIDTSGRAFVYSHVNTYYDFSPLFPGRGIGFLTYQLNEEVSLGVQAVHNDFLQFYIDLGFFGYILWLLSMTVLRTSYFGKGDAGSAVLCMLLMLYLVIVSSTDNTLNYPLLTTVTGVLMIGNGYAQKVKRKADDLDAHPLLL